VFANNSYHISNTYGGGADLHKPCSTRSSVKRLIKFTIFSKKENNMFNWVKKTASEFSTLARTTFNTPAPIGKTVLITGGLVVATFLLTHKVKVILVFG